jgi:hypothetical protein
MSNTQHSVDLEALGYVNTNDDAVQPRSLPTYSDNKREDSSLKLQSKAVSESLKQNLVVEQSKYISEVQRISRNLHYSEENGVQNYWENHQSQDGLKIAIQSLNDLRKLLSHIDKKTYRKIAEGAIEYVFNILIHHFEQKFESECGCWSYIDVLSFLNDPDSDLELTAFREIEEHIDSNSSNILSKTQIRRPIALHNLIWCCGNSLSEELPSLIKFVEQKSIEIIEVEGALRSFVNSANAQVTDGDILSYEKIENLLRFSQKLDGDLSRLGYETVLQNYKNKDSLSSRDALDLLEGMVHSREEGYQELADEADRLSEEILEEAWTPLMDELSEYDEDPIPISKVRQRYFERFDEEGSEEFEEERENSQKSYLLSVKDILSV